MGAIIVVCKLVKLFESHECIRIRKHLKYIFTPHEMGSTAMPGFCRLELPWWTYRPIKTLLVFKLNPFLTMLYTGDFVLRCYVRFSQIRSQICKLKNYPTACSIFCQVMTYRQIDKQPQRRYDRKYISYTQNLENMHNKRHEL